VALFQYKAVTPSGEIQEGVLDSPSQGAVIERLQGMGLIPIRAVEASGAGASQTAVPAAAAFALFAPRRVTQNNVGVFTREIATLLKAGLPLDRSMEILVSLSENERVKELLSEIRNEVRGGSSLSKALDQHREVFSRFYINMVRAGEAGGALPDVLRRLSDYMERARELRDNVTSAMIYPLILFGVSMIAVGILLVFVVPRFTRIFDQAGVALPLLTQIVLSVGNFVKNYWWGILIAAFLAFRYVRGQLANPDSRYQWDKWFWELPLFGELIAKIEMARFARTLGTLLSNGVSLLAGLSIIKETLGNRYLAEAVEEVARELKAGRGLGKPMLQTKRFPQLAVHMVMVGEETGKLDDMLAQVAEVYDREVAATIKRLLALVEPVMLIGMGLVIGIIIMSILSAMLGMTSLIR
jgi:general secretion pathway protein F